MEGEGALRKNYINLTLVSGNESSVINIRQSSYNMFIRFSFKNYTDTCTQINNICKHTIARYPQHSLQVKEKDIFIPLNPKRFFV